MSAIVDFIVLWKDLITKVFGEYPLAAAVFTLIAIAVFLGLDRQWRKGKTPTNLMLVLVGWAVLVPIGGWVLAVLGKLWSFIESTLPFVTTVLGSLYRIYEKHPILVLVISVIALLAYIVWKWRFDKVLPSPTLRVIVLVVGVILAAHIASPIADLFSPAESSVSAKHEKTPQPQPPAVLQPPSVAPTQSTQADAPIPAKARDQLPVQVSPTANPAVEGTLRDKAAQHPSP